MWNGMLYALLINAKAFFEWYGDGDYSILSQEFNSRWVRLLQIIYKINLKCTYIHTLLITFQRLVGYIFIPFYKMILQLFSFLNFENYIIYFESSKEVSGTQIPTFKPSINTPLLYLISSLFPFSPPSGSLQKR